ncbi:hypothetical protein KKF55_06530 [Patescibacteria group bacterium]|nr:hypothetical protein [Patescibacteria group bacterium]
MESSATLDRSQEILSDLRSLAIHGGKEAIRQIFIDFCARKNLELLLDESNLEGSIADQINTLSARFCGQFRQSICRKIEKARQYR